MSDDPRPVDTADPAAIEARVRLLEAFAARGLAAPTPQANPPITIGPFSNVPAPGSPIRSDWPQSISTFTNKLPRGVYRVITKNTNEGGFSTGEFVIAQLGAAATNNPTRLTAISYGLAIVPTVQPGANTFLTVRARAGSTTAGALIGAQMHSWIPNQQNFSSSEINIQGTLPPAGLTVSGDTVLTLQVGAGTYTVGAGSFYVLADVGSAV